MVGKTNFHQDDPRRKGSGDGNDGPNPSTGNGDMLKSAYDSNDDGRVNSADHATTATTADALSGGIGFNLYYGTNELGVKGFYVLPAGGGGGAATFLELTDTPASFAGMAGKVVKVNVGENGLEFVDETGGGASTFIGLTDTPADFTGQAGMMLVVNGTADALEFQAVPSGSGQSLTVKTEADTGELDNWAAWIANPTAGALTRAMPTSPEDGEEVTCIDIGEAAATNNITLTVTGPTTIVGPVIALDGQSKKWRYDSTGDVWNLVFSSASTGGGGGATDFGILTITVPASSIDADLTDFPLVIESAHVAISQDWFDLASASTISLTIQGGAEVNTEVAYFDQAAGVLRLHAKVDLSSTVDNVFTLYAEVAPTLTSNPFTAYELVVPIGYAADVATIKDFSDNDYSGAISWNVTAVGQNPVYNGEGDGLGVNASNIYTDAITIATNLYLVAEGEYGVISTATLAGLSDGSGTMDGVMLRNLSTFGRIASFSDGAGGWQETDNTANAAERGVGERFVASLRYESGGERSVWRDGIGKGTDVTVQNPFPTKTRCTIGTRDNLAEDMFGKVYEVRAADFLPSDAWVKAEALNMGNQGFYSASYS